MKLVSLQELIKPKEVTDFRGTEFHHNAGNTTTMTPEGRHKSWLFTLDTLMAKHGFNRVGQGKYAGVYRHKNYRYIVKIFKKDPAYLLWWKFMQENQGNPYVPRTRGKLVKINEDFFAVRMEILEDLHDYGLKKEFETRWRNDDSEDPNLQKVIKFLDDHDHMVDLHDDNYMQRGNQLVIIDPIYNWFRGGKYVIDPSTVDLKGLL